MWVLSSNFIFKIVKMSISSDPSTNWVWYNDYNSGIMTIILQIFVDLICLFKEMVEEQHTGKMANVITLSSQVLFRLFFDFSSKFLQMWSMQNEGITISFGNHVPNINNWKFLLYKLLVAQFSSRRDLKFLIVPNQLLFRNGLNFSPCTHYFFLNPIYILHWPICTWTFVNYLLVATEGKKKKKLG
jgi:hypothetical protein